MTVFRRAHGAGEGGAAAPPQEEQEQPPAKHRRTAPEPAPQPQQNPPEQQQQPDHFNMATPEADLMQDIDDIFDDSPAKEENRPSPSPRTPLAANIDDDVDLDSLPDLGSPTPMRSTTPQHRRGTPRTRSPHPLFGQAFADEPTQRQPTTDMQRRLIDDLPQTIRDTIRQSRSRNRESPRTPARAHIEQAPRADRQRDRQRHLDDLPSSIRQNLARMSSAHQQGGHRPPKVLPHRRCIRSGRRFWPSFCRPGPRRFYRTSVFARRFDEPCPP